jgi:hypothetical protein
MAFQRNARFGIDVFIARDDDRFGGDLAHVVVMQHVTKEKIDMFIADLIEELPEGIPGTQLQPIDKVK